MRFSAHNTWSSNMILKLTKIANIKVASIWLAISLTAPLLADDSTGEIPMPQMLETKEYRGGIAKTGDLYIAGQPMVEDALRKLKAEGVTTVINLRTREEMANRKSTPIDEEKLLQQLDIKYVHIPSGGSKNPFSPATLDAFAAAMDQSDGKVLLHCNSARRATHIWVAYLVKHKNLPLEEALTYGRAINFGATPIEGYLEGEIDFTLTDQDH
jgi:uncharacterized protein (TIGR01244 family)